MDRKSAMPMSVDTEEVPWAVQVLLNLQRRVQHIVAGKQEQSVEETKMEEMATIIRTYRGLADEDEEDDVKVVWVDRPAFDVFMSCAILINTLTIGIETDDVFAKGHRQVVWLVLEALFCLIFCFEVISKVAYHPAKTRKGKLLWIISDTWNFITTCVAILAILSLLVATVADLVGVNQDAHRVLRMISLVRVVGLVRLVRLIRRYKMLEELRLVIQGLMESFQMLLWVSILIAAFLYVSAVLMTKQVGHNDAIYAKYRKMSGGWDYEEYFGTVGRSMYTLLQCMTLNGWASKIARHVIGNQWYMGAFFVLFLLLSTYGLLNLVVSVIVEQTLTASQNNESRAMVRQARARRQELERIREIFELADADRSGELDQEEFLEACKNEEIQWRLRQLELPVNDAARLFSVIDGNGSRTLTIAEFITGCTKLKGAAQSKDILAVQAQADNLARKMDVLADALSETERMVASLDEVTSRVSRRFSPAVQGSRRKIAHTVGGSAPIVPPPREKHGNGFDTDLSIGNQPLLPKFPNLLR